RTARRPRGQREHEIGQMQLSVRTGLRRGQGIESGPEQSADRGIEIAVGDPLIDAGQGRLTETSHDSRMAFLAEAARIGREVLLHGQESVPNGIVKGRPHERPRQRIDDPRHRGDRRLRRCRVETHPSVVQVVVVEQGDHTRAAPDELFDLGGCGGELAAERVRRNDRTTRAPQSRELDRVRPQQSRTSRRIGLGDARGCDLLRSGPSAPTPTLGSTPGPGPSPAWAVARRLAPVLEAMRTPLPAPWAGSVGEASEVVSSSDSSDTPDVRSQGPAQCAISRSGAASARQSRKSASSVLRYSKRLKYSRDPAKKASLPTKDTSCLSTDAPLA